MTDALRGFSRFSSLPDDSDALTCLPQGRTDCLLVNALHAYIPWVLSDDGEIGFGGWLSRLPGTYFPVTQLGYGCDCTVIAGALCSTLHRLPVQLGPKLPLHDPAMGEREMELELLNKPVVYLTLR
jgi:hypothetical protein